MTAKGVTLEVTVKVNGNTAQTFQMTQGKASKSYLKFHPAPDSTVLMPYSTLYVDPKALKKSK